LSLLKKLAFSPWTLLVFAIGSALAQESHDHSKMDVTSNESLGHFFSQLFKSDFIPHGHCFFWRPDIIWIHVISDGLIAASYFAIPIMLVYFALRKKDLPYGWMLGLFCSFIFLCGMTHVFSIWTLWEPIYRFEGVLKAVTAAVSVITAILLFPLIPKALTLRSAQVLEELNQKLIAENKIRKDTEKKLEESNHTLEQRVTERTSQLRQKSEQLERSNAELEQFAYIASHDLQEPLRMVSSYCQLIKEDIGAGNNQEDIAQYIDFAVEGAHRMKILMDDLLKFSRIGVKDDNLIEDVDCNEALSLALDNLDNLIEESNTRIHFETLPTIQADKVSIVRLFQNLIGNAIKYSREDTIPQINITAEDIGHSWQFSFADNGIGIESEHFERIFMILQRLHARTEYPGTGMGLAICKKIVSSHSGRIWVESTIGKGSTFYFVIPKIFSAEKEV